MRFLANRMAVSLPPHLDWQDLEACGAMGLLAAFDSYDPSRGVKFESYAGPRVRGAILDAVKQAAWTPGLHKRVRKLEQTVGEVEARLGRAATDAEIAEAMGVDLVELDTLRGESAMATIVYLEDHWRGDSEEGTLSVADHLVDDRAVDPHDTVETSERNRRVAEALQLLPEKERLVVTLFYYEGLSGVEIARVMDLSVARISQLHQKAILRLRGRLGRVKQLMR